MKKVDVNNVQTSEGVRQGGLCRTHNVWQVLCLRKPPLSNFWGRVSQSLKDKATHSKALRLSTRGRGVSCVKEHLIWKPQASCIQRLTSTALHVSLSYLYAWAESKSWNVLCSERWEQRELLRADAPWDFITQCMWAHEKGHSLSPRDSDARKRDPNTTQAKPLSLSYSVFSLYGQQLQTRRTQHRRNLSNREAREFPYFKSWPQISRSNTLRAVTSHFFSGPDLPLDSDLDLPKISSLFPEVFLRDLVSTQPELWKTDSQFLVQNRIFRVPNKVMIAPLYS